MNLQSTLCKQSVTQQIVSGVETTGPKDKDGWKADGPTLDSDHSELAANEPYEAFSASSSADTLKVKHENSLSTNTYSHRYYFF